MWPAILRFFRKLWCQVQRERFRRELAEELALHADLKLREHTAAGVPIHLAAPQTRREMGNITFAAEVSADVRSFLSLEHLVKDIRYGLRLLVKQLGFSLVVIVSLALG